MMSSDREKIEIIIRDISQLEINETNTRDRNISNIERLIQLKKDLQEIKPDSRLASTPSIKELNSKMKKLLIQKKFHDMEWQDPNKLLMAITPGFVFICLVAPPIVLFILTLSYTL